MIEQTIWRTYNFQKCLYFASGTYTKQVRLLGAVKTARLFHLHNSAVQLEIQRMMVLQEQEELV